MTSLVAERTTILGILVGRPNLMSLRNSVGWLGNVARMGREVYGTQNIERVAAGVNHRVGHSVISNFYHSSREFRFLSNIFHAGHYRCHRPPHYADYSFAFDQRLSDVVRDLRSALPHE